MEDFSNWAYEDLAYKFNELDLRPSLTYKEQMEWAAIYDELGRRADLYR